ncbi:hypothetical protein CH63R_03592 [Colletotrichum higginsianum IMI 349063]|uniref:Uncharacterized protein n=1 Tax=Colletotrichum higginsianum (strain IMI 349063) TaxID=759273 RepID=A0A1B7YGW4_COLHI|nr:hypothetical protein CH63R_03592 [Colletotrichum higginsianum IMI 349063]OBR11296.1 hypothetical protein CH63R_03592 [Colletotrichum higginsianum IMI 349063]
MWKVNQYTDNDHRAPSPLLILPSFPKYEAKESHLSRWQHRENLSASYRYEILLPQTNPSTTLPPTIQHRIIRQVSGKRWGTFAIGARRRQLCRSDKLYNNHGASNDDPVYFLPRILWAKTDSRPLLVEAPKPYIFNYTSAACAGVRSPAARLWAATFLSQMSCSFRFQSPLPSPGRN